MSSISLCLARPLKIALLCDWYLPKVGGIERHLHDLAARLIDKGHVVQVLTPVPGSAGINGIHVHRLTVPLFRYFRLTWTPGAFREIASIIGKEHYDVVHCHTSYIAPTAYGGAYLSNKLGVPTVITFHSILGHFVWMLGALDRTVHWSRWPVVFSAVSRVVASDIKRLVAPREIHILPDAVDPSAWKVAPAQGDPKEVRIVSVMRMSPRKRGKALIKIIHRVRARIPEEISLKVIIIGDGIQRKAMERLISRWKLENTVKMVGYQTRTAIRDYFAYADIFVLPSIRESFGIAALEARCAGLPVVAMKNTAIEEFICHGQEGLLAETDHEMVALLVRLILDRELRLSLARYNRETPPFTNWEEVIAKHMELYELAIDTRKDEEGRGRTAA